MAKVENFRFWCQKVLPLVYDDSLSYYELLCKMVTYLNNTIQAVNENTEDVTNMRSELTEFEGAITTEVSNFKTYVNVKVAELESYMNNYFNSLDVQNEINVKLDVMAQSGELTNLMKPYIDSMTEGFDERIDYVEDGLVVLRERVNEITNLPEGSTAGDAELADIRIGANGYTYDNAGNAVRGQFETNAGSISAIRDILVSNNIQTALTPYAETQNYWMETQGNGVAQNGYIIRRFRVTPNSIISLKVIGNNSPCNWCFKKTGSALAGDTDGIPHNNGCDTIVKVPSTSEYLFMSLPANDTQSGVKVISPLVDNCLISGLVFVLLAGNKIVIHCLPSCRALINKEYVNVSSFSTVLNKPTSATDCVVLTSTGFVAKEIKNVTANELKIATVYASTVYSDVEGVITNTPWIKGLAQRSGVPIFINSKKTKKYKIQPVSTSRVQNFGDFVKIVNGVASTQAIAYYDEPTNRFFDVEGSIYGNNVSLENKKILCIGDSVTNRGWYQKRIKDYVGSIQFLGTRNTQFNSLKCEGYSGCKAKDVLGSESITPYGESTIANPFWNTTSNQIDFENYCVNVIQNVPDMVIIQFGLNETNSNDYLNYVQNFINNIKASYPDMLVYVIQPFGEADGASPNRTTISQNTVLRRCILNAEILSDCVLIPCWYIMVDEYDYNKGTMTYGYNNVEVECYSDSVHPNENVGFAKLGDMIYNHLGYVPL